MSRKIPSELHWLVRRIRPFIGWHMASFACMTAASFLTLGTPLILKWLIDQILPRRETGRLLLAMALIFVGYQGRAALASAGNYLTLCAVQKMVLRLRTEVLRQLDRLSASYYENTVPGAAMYPLKEPIEEVAYFGSDLVPAISRLALATALTILTMSLLSPRLTLAILPLVPVFLLTRQHFRKKLSAESDSLQRDLLAWHAFVEEHIASIVSIQLLGREKRQERKAFGLQAQTTRSYGRLFKTGARLTLGTSLAVVVALSAVIGLGGWGVLAGSLSLGTLVAFYSFVTQLFDPLSGAAELYVRAQKTFASVRQLETVFSLRPTVTESPNCVDFPQQHWALEFRAVEFGYGGETTLQVPWLRIGGGEKVAILGENGAGKSTLARLIPRVYDVQAGLISVGGVGIAEIRLKSLRSRISYLPRDPVLFDGSLASNLRFVRPDASERELITAMHWADLDEVVARLPQGIDQRVGPDGCQLSGGQRQRLAIARAFLQRPRILILDEATSCLDPSSEALILGNLFDQMDASTLIVVSHRASTLSRFGRVLVLDRGRIVKDLGGGKGLSPLVGDSIRRGR